MSEDYHSPGRPYVIHITRPNISYPLAEIPLLCLRAVLAGAESLTEIAPCGVKKLALLRRFHPFKDCTPATDLGDMFATLDAEQFQPASPLGSRWRPACRPGVIAMDEKTPRFRQKGR